MALKNNYKKENQPLKKYYKELTKFYGFGQARHGMEEAEYYKSKTLMGDLYVESCIHLPD